MHATAARALLGVSINDDVDAIKRAFRRRVQAAHPDRGGDALAFGRLVEAQRIALADAATRCTRRHALGYATSGPTSSRRWVDVQRRPVTGTTRSSEADGPSFGDVLARVVAADLV
jgi:hypothetical protein